MGGAEAREEATEAVCARVEGQTVTDLLVGRELEDVPYTGAHLGVESLIEAHLASEEIRSLLFSISSVVTNLSPLSRILSSAMIITQMSTH